jgi:hypothetical protein
MGSVFVDKPDKTVSGFLGKESTVPFYLQFVPGVVVEAVHSRNSLYGGSDRHINSIIAYPHISDKPFKRRGSLGEGNRYYPLLRGISDTPSNGDPVLLCTIGNVNYYLGPINTPNNSPTWNRDPSYKIGQTIGNPTRGGSTKRNEAGESDSFNRETLWPRLSKFWNVELDYGGRDTIFETTGDTIIEGRHGNSLRIGSRSDNPYLFLSNGRHPDNNVETIQDGALITITKKGTLAQHLGGYSEVVGKVKLPAGETELLTDTTEFTLSSDKIEENTHTIGNMVSSINNVKDPYPLIYGYDSNQILITTDRIIMNTRIDDIYLSSNKDIHIGTGRHLTISTNKNLVIESDKTYLGDPNKEDNKEMEPMIMGQTLLDILQELTAILKGAQFLCNGAPLPLADDTGAPGGVKLKITQIEQKLNTILSEYHFIEPNKGVK